MCAGAEYSDPIRLISQVSPDQPSPHPKFHRPIRSIYKVSPTKPVLIQSFPKQSGAYKKFPQPIRPIYEVSSISPVHIQSFPNQSSPYLKFPPPLQDNLFTHYNCNINSIHIQSIFRNRQKLESKSLSRSDVSLIFSLIHQWI